MVTRSNRPAFSSEVSVREQLELLREVTSVMERRLCVSLPVPDVDFSSSIAQQVKKVKQFSVGLLENPVSHDWSSELSRAKVRSSDRLSVAGSLFLWRKTLPSFASHFEEHKLRVTAPELPLPPSYDVHIDHLVDDMFPVGWDRKLYPSAVRGCTPSTSSTLEAGRKVGGARSLGRDRHDFLKYCLTDTRKELNNSLRYSDVQCDGKSRAVTIASADQSFLAPLHKALYDHISTMPWLLRGEATPSSFSKFRMVPGEVFVSGDYENATDHLPVSTAERILRLVLANSVSIPSSVKLAALASLRPVIVYPDGSKARATRQLMGSLLCFPLLCLQNYIAFRWVFPDSVPVKINGDDIVFRSTRSGFQSWASFVGTVGLRLSVGKTMVHSRNFSLNSTFFRASPGKPVLVPVVRFCSLLRNTDTAGGLDSACRRFLKGFKGELRTDLLIVFLRRKSPLLRATGRSVFCHGLSVCERSLKASGLWDRELWFANCGLPERELPIDPWRLRNTCKMEGWKRRDAPRCKEKLKQMKSEQELFFRELVSACWKGVEVNPSDAVRDYWDEVKVTGYEGFYKGYRRNLRKRPLKPFLARLGIPVLPKMRARLLFDRMNKERVKRTRIWVRDRPLPPRDNFKCPVGCDDPSCGIVDLQLVDLLDDNDTSFTY